MVTVLILIVLAWQFFIGYRRGIILEAYYFIGAIVSMLLSGLIYQTVADKLSLWVPYINATQNAKTYFFGSDQLFQLDKVFYAGIAFTLMSAIIYLIVRFIGIFLHLIRIPGLNSRLFRLISGVLSLIIALVSVNMLLTIAATIPVDQIQEPLNDSWLASLIINHTPVMSDIIQNIWVNNIIG